MRTIAIVLLFSALASVSLGQTSGSKKSVSPRSQVWLREPTSFFGVRFGAPIEASIAECHKDMRFGNGRYDFPNGEGPCFTNEFGSVELFHIEGFFHISVQLVDGNVAQILAPFHDFEATQTAVALITKFGQPTYRKTSTVQSKAGASYEDLNMVWRGHDLTISYSSVSFRVDEGLLAISNRAYDVDAAKQQIKTNKSLADSF